MPFQHTIGLCSECGGLTPKVSGVFWQNQSVVQKSGNDCWNQKKYDSKPYSQILIVHKTPTKVKSIQVVQHMKILGTTFTDGLYWNKNSDSIVNKKK